MTDLKSLIRSMEQTNALAAVALVAIAGLLFGPTWATASAAIGAAMSIANYRVLSWFASNIAAGSDKAQAAFAMIFVLKLLVLMASCYVFVVVLSVDVAGFLLGVSAMPAAALIGSLRQYSTNGPSSGGNDTAPVVKGAPES